MVIVVVPPKDRAVPLPNGHSWLILGVILTTYDRADPPSKCWISNSGRSQDIAKSQGVSRGHRKTMRRTYGFLANVQLCDWHREMASLWTFGCCISFKILIRWPILRGEVSVSFQGGHQFLPDINYKLQKKHNQLVCHRPLLSMVMSLED